MLALLLVISLWRISVNSFINILRNWSVKLSGCGTCQVGSFKITNSISYLFICLFIFSISSWANSNSFCLFRNLSIHWGYLICLDVLHARHIPGSTIGGQQKRQYLALLEHIFSHKKGIQEVKSKSHVIHNIMSGRLLIWSTVLYITAYQPIGHYIIIIS